jgi:hypothetical protein
MAEFDDQIFLGMKEGKREVRALGEEKRKKI